MKFTLLSSCLDSYIKHSPESHVINKFRVSASCVKEKRNI